MNFRVMVAKMSYQVGGVVFVRHVDQTFLALDLFFTFLTRGARVMREKVFPYRTAFIPAHPIDIYVLF